MVFVVHLPKYMSVSLIGVSSHSSHCPPRHCLIGTPWLDCSLPSLVLVALFYLFVALSIYMSNCNIRHCDGRLWLKSYYGLMVFVVVSPDTH